MEESNVQDQSKNQSENENSNNINNSDKKLSDFDKLLGYNKLGSLLLSADRYEHSIQIFSKGIDLYEKINKNLSSNFMFFANLYCNIAKSYSCLKQFDKADPYYRKCINFHPIYNIINKEKELFKKNFNLDIEKDFLENYDKITDEDMKTKNVILLKFFNDRSNKIFLFSIVFKKFINLSL